MVIAQYLMRVATLIVSCALLVACQDGDDNVTAGDVNAGTEAIAGGVGQAPRPYASRIHVLVATDGTLAPSPDADASWVLTLNGIAPEAQWYADRPGRETGSVSLAEYAGELWSASYGEIPPHATLAFALPDNERHGVYLALSDPTYDGRTGSMTFQAEILDHSLDDMQGLLSFSGVALNVLNNAVDDQHVASYVQYAGQAILQPQANSVGFELVLRNTGAQTLWVDNAPGRYSDSRPLSQFLAQWPYVFDDDPPNAALFGTTAAGDTRVHFLTLTDPQYHDELDELRYAATLLGQTHGGLEALHHAVLDIDSGFFSSFPMPGKGTGYQAFSAGYKPDTAGQTSIYFGSDIARNQMGSLWGTESHLRASCEPHCRDDLGKMQKLGINLVRLYDWDPRNDHSRFLDYADQLGIKVVVPISNWLPQQDEKVWDEQVPGYFTNRNFANRGENDWHPAIAGVIISNELDMESDGKYYGHAVGLAARFLREIEAQGFGKHVRVGIPVTFVPRAPPYAAGNVAMPSWGQFDQFVNDPRIAPYKDQIMLCTNTYNSRDYLFTNAEATGKGWVPLTYQQFGIPILFTEIGLSRAESSFTPAFVRNQLQGVLEYQKVHPDQLLGAAHFQFDDKVWKQTEDDSDTEGAFGMFHHAQAVAAIPTVEDDYDFDSGAAHLGSLHIDALAPTATYDAVVEAYGR